MFGRVKKLRIIGGRVDTTPEIRPQAEPQAEHESDWLSAHERRMIDAQAELQRRQREELYKMKQEHERERQEQALRELDE